MISTIMDWHQKGIWASDDTVYIGYVHLSALIDSKDYAEFMIHI